VTRASDDEREATVRRLQQAASEGRLTADELDGRLDAAYAATTRAELEPLTADLPGATAPAPIVEPGERASSVLFGIFGGSDRTGRWRVPRRMTVINVFGGADLDLRQARLSAPEVRITVLSLSGGSDIIVPEGMRSSCRASRSSGATTWT
jgi:uncharacterized protein DUF1707